METIVKFGKTLKRIEERKKPERVESWSSLTDQEKGEFICKRTGKVLQDSTGMEYFRRWKHVEQVSTKLESFYKKQRKEKRKFVDKFMTQFKALKTKKKKLAFVFAVECGLDCNDVDLLVKFFFESLPLVDPEWQSKEDGVIMEKWVAFKEKKQKKHPLSSPEEYSREEKKSKLVPRRLPFEVSSFDNDEPKDLPLKDSLSFAKGAPLRNDNDEPKGKQDTIREWIKIKSDELLEEFETIVSESTPKFDGLLEFANFLRECLILDQFHCNFTPDGSDDKDYETSDCAE